MLTSLCSLTAGLCDCFCGVKYPTLQSHITSFDWLAVWASSEVLLRILESIFRWFEIWEIPKQSKNKFSHEGIHCSHFWLDIYVPVWGLGCRDNRAWQSLSHTHLMKDTVPYQMMLEDLHSKISSISRVQNYCQKNTRSAGHIVDCFEHSASSLLPSHYCRFKHKYHSIVSISSSHPIVHNAHLNWFLMHSKRTQMLSTSYRAWAWIWDYQKCTTYSL